MISILINIVVLSFLFYKSKALFAQSSLSSSYYYLLGIKLFFGIAYAYIFTFYYIEDNDSKCYHHDGQMFNWYFWNEPIRFFKIVFFNEYECENQIYEFWMRGLDRAFFFSKFISIIYILCSSNYWIVTIYVAFVSFLGTYFFANTLVLKYINIKSALIVGFFLWPNIQLWTSGLLKETIALSAMYVIIALVFDTTIKVYLKILIAILLLILIVKIKFYYLIFLPFLFVYIIATVFKKNFKIIVLIVTLATIFIMYYSDNYVYNFMQMLLYSHDVSYYTMYHSNSNNHFGDITMSLYTFVKNTPDIIFKSCFSPNYLPEISLFRNIESVSNLVLIFLLVWSLSQVFMYRIKFPLLVWLTILFICIAGFIVGYTVPNFGALVRIRVFYESFLIFLLMLVPSNWLSKFNMFTSND